MAFNVDALANYTKQNAQNLVTSSVLGAKTIDLIKQASNVMVGVKSSETINIMDTDTLFQSGSNCGFTASGTTTFTQRTVTVGKIKVNESLCPKDLEAKYLQEALPRGSRYDSIIFAEQYSQRKAQKIADALEKAVWQGDTTSVDTQLLHFDGLIKQVNAGAVQANASPFIGTVATSITASNVIAVMDAVYAAIPAAVVDKDDVVIMCGMDVFRTYTIALKNANLFHYNYDGKANGEFTLPGTTIRVIATPGLNGTSKVYAMRLSNIFFGTDLLDEQERFDIFYAREADQVRFIAEFKAGVNVAFPGEVVKFTV
jgi:hypothetical protein